MATTDDTLVSATRAQGARVAVKNFIMSKRVIDGKLFGEIGIRCRGPYKN